MPDEVSKYTFRHNPEDRLAAMKVFQGWIQDPDLLVLDTETTGLTDNDEVIELAVVHYHSRVTAFHSLIRPTAPIAEEASKKHGLTLELLQHAPTLTEVWDAIRSVLHGKQVAAFNSNFDRDALDRSAKKYGLEPLEAKWLCVMREYAPLTGQWNTEKKSYRWPKLQDVLPGREQHHRALEDTLALCDLIESANLPF